VSAPDAHDDPSLDGLLVLALIALVVAALRLVLGA
jgi:hypothetical protein